MAELALGTDVGGTFTDVVLWAPDGEGTRTWKVPTTPEDPSVGALQGMDAILERTGHAWASVGRVVHGTTAATNALLEETGGRVGLVTNEGFEDVVEIGRQDRPSLYDLEADPPDPLVARRDRHGVVGRVGPDGAVEEPLDEAAVRGAADELGDVDAVVVAFLHSWANPDHEEAAAGILREELTGVRAVASSAVDGSFREYERFATALAHAYLAPVLDDYLAGLEEGLARRNPEAGLHVLDSGGGLLTPRAARDRPARAALSGPAGGLVGAAAATTWEDRPDLLALDMGGTSTDCGLVLEGAPRETPAAEVGGRPLRVRALDLETVGAGGGSLAGVEEGALLKVGPASAGADPGPACYGRGGTRPTVTDAHVVLGRLAPDGFLGGRMGLDAGAAREAVARHVAEPLGEPVEEAAAGILEVAETRMKGALRVVATARGSDPRDLALLAYGGAGPLHAAPLARELGIPEVLVPPSPGVFSARGTLHARLRHGRDRSLLEPVDALGPSDLEAALAAAADAVEAAFAADGVPAGDVDVGREARLRYEGQSHAVPVAVEEGDAPADLARRFHDAHEARYGLRDAHRPVTLVGLRVAGAADPGIRPDPPSPEPGEGAEARERRVRFRDGWASASIRRRSALAPGTGLKGPAVVEGRDSTVLVPPGAEAVVTDHGALRLEVGR
jgi:N-methylhydantoinase A